MKAKFLATVIALVFVLAACSSETNKDIEITEVWITLPDGIRLACLLYTSDAADE